jgi:hypothetical protein
MAIKDFFKRVFENVGGESDSDIAKFFGGMFSPEDITNETGKTVKIESSKGIVPKPLSSRERLNFAENVVKDTDRDTSALEQKYVKDYFGSYADLIKQTSKGSDLKFSNGETSKQTKFREVPKSLTNIFKDTEKWDNFRKVVGSIESNVDGYKARKGKHTGYFQMSPVGIEEARAFDKTLTPVGTSEKSRQMFMDNPELQERYYEAFVEANHKMLMTSDSYKNLSSDDKMGVLAYAQQGFGNARAYVEKGIVSVDGNNVKGTKYIDALVKEMNLKVTSPYVFAQRNKVESNKPERRPIVNKQGLRVSDKPFLRPNMKTESNN